MSTEDTNSDSSTSSKEDTEPYLFPLPPPKPPRPSFRPISEPIWTKSKARLIEEYLHLFTLVTKHGTYIDGFSGPQEPDRPEMWSAKLVLGNNLLQHFYLFERDNQKVKVLEALKKLHHKKHVELFPGDFNIEIHKFLGSGRIKDKEAAFCLIDQRTFECHWKSIEAIAAHRKTGYKIELFYFLANQWLPRAFSGLRDDSIPERWWGRTDWRILKEMNSHERVMAFVKRFESELHYKYVNPWPINERLGRGHLMYHMIHAADHIEAPRLMRRAYDKAARPEGAASQIELNLQPPSP